MPTEITITAYKYEELEGRAKEKAHAKLTEWATDYEWWDSIYTDAKEDGAEKGFEIDDIRFSGFWSQGDGAHWTGRINVQTFIEANLDERSAWYGEDVILLELWKEGWVDRYIQIHNRNYRYSHSGGMSIGDYPDNALYGIDEDDDAVLNEGVMQGANVYQLSRSLNDYETRINEWCDEALTQARAFADDIYKKLEKEYDHYVSEESLIEFASANEYLFNEKGEVL
jgi:hypothetical protein